MLVIRAEFAARAYKSIGKNHFLVCARASPIFAYYTIRNGDNLALF